MQISSATHLTIHWARCILGSLNLDLPW